MIFCFFVVRSRSSSFVWVLQGVRNGTVSLERLHFGGPRGRSRGIPHSSKAAGPVFCTQFYRVLSLFFLLPAKVMELSVWNVHQLEGVPGAEVCHPISGNPFRFYCLFFFGGRKNGASFLNFAFRRISWGREKEEDFLFFLKSSNAIFLIRQQVVAHQSVLSGGIF